MDINADSTRSVMSRDCNWLSMGHDRIFDMLDKLMHTIRTNI
jgi:hypothetical protein